MMRYQGLSPDNLPLSNGRKSHWRSCKEDEGITTNTRQIDDENDVEPHKGVPKSRSPSSKLAQDQNFSTYSTTFPNSLPKSNHDLNNNNTTPLHNGGGSGDMLLQWGHRKRSRNRSATAAGAAANGSALADDSSSSSWTQLQAMLKVPRRSITVSPHATATAELIETKNSSDTNIMPPPSSVSSNLISRTASAAAAVTTNSSTANGKVGNHKSPTKDSSSFVNRRNLEDRSGSGSGSHPTRNGGSNSKGVMAASSSRSKVVKRSPQKVVEKNDRTTGCSSVTASLRDDDKTNGLSRQEQEVGGLETSHYKNNIGSSLPHETGCSNATTNTNNNHEDSGRIKIVAGAAAVNEVYEWPRVHIPLTRKEKEEDFLLMKGTKLPHRPKKRPKAVDRMLQSFYPIQTSPLFSFVPPKTLNPKRPFKSPNYIRFFPNPKLSLPKAFSSDEFPVDESFLEQFGPKDKDTEDEARRKNWVDRGWAPWEEILSPEADFARKSLNEGEEVELQNPETIEAFKMLVPKYRKQKMDEMGLTEDEYLAKQFEIKGEKPEPLNTMWAGPMVVRHVPPRDWPPRGWEVDKKELEFIREAHKLMAVRVDYDQVEKDSRTDTDRLCLDRYKVFLKQYNEWVEANKDRLEEESYKYDQDYYPGRRKRGKDYKEGMFELPFYYPGQICVGKVTTLHLYQGAFVDIGGVHDGWVPIKRNDWYWIRHHIKVGMSVIVEILAKRDPYRFRFPIEMRFVDPNIDHLIFKRFDFPPIFHRDEDANPEELRRDSGRPPIPRKDPGTKVEEEPLLSNHPYVDKLWQLHNAEQIILDDYESNPEKYKDKNLKDLTDDEEFDEENSIEYTKTYYKKKLLPKVILKTSVKELDMEAALAERQHHNKLRKEAEKRGEKFKVHKMRRNEEMDEYDFIHWRRSFEEREALIRDISCRQALGLPLEEPGRYVDASQFGKDQYDPDNPLYRYDYWGEPKNSERSKQDRLTDAHNKSIVGKGTVWYEMSYEDAIKLQQRREAQGKVQKPDEDDTDECQSDDDSDSDFDYSIFTDPAEDESNQPVVNGTQSSRISSDDGIFGN